MLQSVAAVHLCHRRRRCLADLAVVTVVSADPAVVAALLLRSLCRRMPVTGTS